jgi:glycine cleavage system H protein
MDVDGCPLPEDRLYDRSLESWILLSADGTAKMGLTASWAAFLGPIERIGYRSEAGMGDRGRSVATIESTRTTVPLRLPLAAEVIETNRNLASRPQRINEDPYGEGWIVSLRPVRPVEVDSDLATAAEIRAAILVQIAELRIHCWPVPPRVEMVEIGLECSAIFSLLDEELARRGPGEAVLLVTDDPTSPIEMIRWVDRTGHRLRAERRQDSLFQFLIQKEERPTPRHRSVDGSLISDGT